ncbi:exo-alpha-sialidase [Thauera butanivorans]|uniref:exo-alpha-sialidase n=1 Tax=Thauera butanivorans TaxID=86174 RepID=UPI000AEEA8F7|nr:exo-alpha-sialidase [Thauera butanivorans]
MLDNIEATARPRRRGTPGWGTLLARRAVLAAMAVATTFAAAVELPPPGRSHDGATARSELGASAAFAPDGTLHAVVKRGEQVLLYRSADAGTSWGAPVVVNATPEPISADGENRPKIAFAADGVVLVSWTRPLARRFSGEIRLARGAGDGHFAAPITVHRDQSEITHRFESLMVASDGRVVVAWIDKRDLEAATAAGQDYRGTALYAAVSGDGGRTFQPERKVADHSCECCRIAAAADADGTPLFFWRQVFEANERDHALASLGPDGAPAAVERATFDHWRIDACPHHGPGLAVGADGTRHAVWFSERDGEGRVFYGRLRSGAVEGQRPLGGEGAAHADVAAAGDRVAVVWKEFDGERTRLRAEIVEDGGRRFHALELAASAGATDQPRLLTRNGDFFAFWHTEAEGLRGYALN